MKKKTTSVKAALSQASAPYPNAATRRQVLHKVLDAALVTVSCLGIAAMLLLLPVLA